MALVATVLGVIYAATDSNPSGASDAALNYHGSLRTAQMEITIDTGQRYDVNGTIDMNFVTNRIRATVNIPLFFSTATISAIMANSQLYLTTPSIQSTAAKPWLSIPHGTNDLFPIQSTLEDFRQNLFCLQAIGPVKVTTTGPYTTYSTVGAVPKDTCMVPSPVSYTHLTLPTIYSV